MDNAEHHDPDAAPIWIAIGWVFVVIGLWVAVQPG